MNPFLALFLLVNIALAHLPSTPAALRRSAAHKRRDLAVGDNVQVVGQSSDGSFSVSVNGLTTTYPSTSPDTQSPTSSPTTSPTSDPQLSTTPQSSDPQPSSTPPSSDPQPSSTPSSDPQPSSTPPSADSEPTSTPPSSDSDPTSTPPSSDSGPSSTPPSSTDPTPSSSSPDPSSSPCGLLGLGVLCPSSTQTPSSTDVSPSPTTTDPPNASSPSDPQSTPTPVSSDATSDPPPPQTSQPSLTTDTTTTSTVTPGDLCSLLGVDCPSSTPLNNVPVSTQPPLTSTDTTTVPPPSSSPTGDQCLLFGIGCPPSSPVSSDTALNPPYQTSQPPSITDTATVPPPSSSPTGDQCLLSGIGCLPSSPVSSDAISNPPYQTSQLPSITDTPLTSTSTDLCALFGIGCSPTSTPVSSDPPDSTLPPSGTLPSSSDSFGFTQPPTSEPLPTTSASLPSDSSPPLPSFPSSPLPSSSPTDDSTPTVPPTTPPPSPTNTQFGWLTQTSLIFSSYSTPTLDGMSLTDPDQDPTSTSFATAGTPSVAPSDAPLPSGIPARIVPGASDGDDVDPSVDNLSGFTLVAILFDQGFNWDFVVQNTDSAGQIFKFLPTMIQTALGVTGDQVKNWVLQVWIPNTYQGPSDISQLGTTWLGFIPTPQVDNLAAQIKVETSPFYTDLPSPYSDLAKHIIPAFDITTITNNGAPGSGVSNPSSSGGSSTDSRTRENAIIGVVSALGGITLIILGFLIYRAIQKRRELAHQRLSDPPANPFIGEAPPNRNFDQDSIGGQRRRSFYFAEDSLRGFSDNGYTGDDGARLSPEQPSGLNRRPIAGNIGPPVMRENSLNF